MEKQGDYLIDYEHKYSAKLNGCNIVKCGWKVFDNKDMKLHGLLDLNKIAIWYIDESTLSLIK